MRPSEEGHGECSDSARSFWVFLRTQARFPSCAQERPAQKLREGSNVIFSMAKGIASVAETGLYHEEVFEVTDRFGKRRTYILEPNEFILALTYEHVWIPRNLIAMVEGRSSYARVGLSMHQTAPWRWGRLSLEELTEEGWAKLRKLAAEIPVRDDPPDPVTQAKARAEGLQWSTDALLRLLIDNGVLDTGDFNDRRWR